MTSSGGPDQLSDYCSIFCRETDFSLVAKALDTRAHVIEMKANQTGESIHALCGAFEIRLSALPWTGPGQELAKTVLGALTYVRRIATVHEHQKQDLLATLPECRLLIGVAGTAGLLSDDACLSAVHAVAADTRGIIFDGADFFNPGGVLILSHDGRSETADP